MRSTGNLIKHVANELESAGYVVVQQYLDADTCAALAAECRAFHAAGQLRPAAVGRGGGRRERREIRGDRTRWFDAAALTPAQAAYWRALQALRGELNRALLLGLEDLEAHYALYPPGAHYARHRDRFHDDDARVLSSAIYLNPDWKKGDGGALRLHLNGIQQYPHVDIYPEAGTLVVFLSADFEHEVLAAARERLSVAGWFRRRGQYQEMHSRPRGNDS
jgi:SM-20-related protein